MTAIQVNDCHAVQLGNILLLYTIYSPVPDTAFPSNDTLTIHRRSAGPLQVEVFVAP